MTDRQRQIRRITAGVGLLLATLPPWVARAEGAEGPSTPTIEVKPSPLTPYNSGGCTVPSHSCYLVFGSADPGIKIELTVRDTQVPPGEVTLSVIARVSDDPGSGAKAGDWFASPNVTDLGGHGLSESMLTFEAFALDDEGRASPPATVTVPKVSATPGDSFAPELKPNNKNRPPPSWCPTGLPCGDPCLVHSALVALNLGGNPSSQCTGEASISGSVEDKTQESLGVASEIADVVIRIEREDGSLWGELHPFLRRGTQAFYGTLLRIKDFDPGTYWVVEYAIDAAGNKSEEWGPWSFTVQSL